MTDFEWVAAGYWPLTPAGSLLVGRALFVTLLVILNGVGLSITPMLTALGVGGLAVALALQEPLANFFAGVFLTLSGQIRLGDYVKLDSGQEGYVADFSWRSTRLGVSQISIRSSAITPSRTRASTSPSSCAPRNSSIST